MNDDKNNDFVEDIEFDDIEDFDDDLLDDDFTADEDELASDVDLQSADFDDDEDWGDEDGSVSDEAPVKSKSSSSKLLLPLLVLLAAGGGGFFYYTQMMGAGSSDNYAPQEQTDPMQDQVGNELAPQSIDPIDISAEDPSIPMPSPISNETDNIAEIDTSPEINQTENFDISEAAPSLQTPDNDVLTPMPNPISNGSSTFDDAAVEDIADNTSDVSDMANVSNELTADGFPSQDENFGAQSNQEIITATPTLESNADINQNNVDTEITNNANNAEIGQIRNEMSALRDKMEKQISDLNSAISKKDSTIQSLENQVQEMESNLTGKDKELASLREELQSAQADSATANATSKSQVTSKAAAKPVVSKKTISRAPEQEVMPKWELRSAQPGRAYVSIKGSNDVQVIEQGDTLHGIGKILSISNKNGLWVVQGTNSNITQ